MEYVKKNRMKVAILAMLFVAAIVHRTGVISSLLAGDTTLTQDRPTEEPPAAKAEQAEVVSLRHFNWPDSNLEELMDFSPFGATQTPERSSEEQAAETADEPLLERKVTEEPVAEIPATVTQRLKAVYYSKHGPVAMVGTQRVRVGDTLNDGRKVLAIRGREVVLQLKQPEPVRPE